MSRREIITAAEVYLDQHREELIAEAKRLLSSGALRVSLESVPQTFKEQLNYEQSQPKPKANPNDHAIPSPRANH